jgi:peroxiredoxin
MARARRFATVTLGVLLAGSVALARAEEPEEPEAPPEDAAPERPDTRGIAVGKRAPDLDVPGWVNVPDGKEPTLASLQGRAVYLEFWATTCGPCVRTMPKVQAIHDRYGPRGLVVLALSPDPAYKQEEFAKEKGLTFPMGVDAADAVRQAYDVPGIPTTYLIGKDGNVFARTSPIHADDEIDRLLGYATGPTGPLSDYLAALAAKDAGSARFHLERGGSRAKVDLAAWAKAAGGTAPADAKAAAKVDGGKALRDLARAKAAGDAAKAKGSLDALATGGPQAFDLGAWARETCGRDYPMTAQELKDLAAAKRYDALVDAILDRRPPPSAIDGVVKDAALQAYAAQNAKRERTLARKATMILTWPLAEKFFKDEAVNERFWGDLGSSGWVEDKTTRKPIAMDVEGTMIFKDTGPVQVSRWLSRAVVMDALSAGKRPDLGKVEAGVAKARAAIEKDLRAAYGD